MTQPTRAGQPVRSGRPSPDGVVHFAPPPGVPVAAVQGTLALDLEPRREPPGLAPVIAMPAASRGDVDELESWARRYAQAAVEIVGGDRPVSQLLRWTSQEVYENLERRAQLVARAGQHQAGVGRVQPVRPRVLGIRACFLSEDVAEVSAHVRYGARSRALAARYERCRDRTGWRWCCTALEFA